MASQWEHQQGVGPARRRLLLPLSLVVLGVLAGVVWMPSDGRSEFSVVPEAEPAVPGDPAPAEPVATRRAGGRWTTGDPGPLSPRAGAVAVAVDDGVVVWGGEGLGSKEALTDGAVYDPVADDWRSIPDAPIPGRVGAAATWTGSEVVVWGGLRDNRALDDGAAYNPRTRRWRRLPPSPLSGRFNATAVSTHGHVLIWGGGGRSGIAALAEGAALDLRRNRWTAIPPGPLAGRRDREVRAVPTDDGMFVWSSNGSAARTALYDPRDGQWREVTTPRLDPEHPVAFTALDGNVVAWGRSTIGNRGPLALVFTTSPDWWSTLAVPPLTPEPGQTMTGGRGTAVSGLGPGVMFDALVNRWAVMATAPQPAAVGDPAHIWAGDRLFVWYGLAQPDAQRRTVVWRPGSPWREVEGSPVPFANGMSVVWSGWLQEQQQVLIWGGIRDDVSNAGAAYDPQLDLWETMPQAPIAGRYGHAAVFTGTRMVVLGGYDAGFRPRRDGAAYLPQRRTWERLAAPPMHVTRGGAAWSGKALYAAGERDGRTVVARFDAGRNRWRVLQAPPARVAGEATHVVWTGFEVWVWTAGGKGAPRGSAWDPDRRQWRRLPAHPPVYGRPAVAWSGSRMYVVDMAGATTSLGRGTEGWRRHPDADVDGSIVEVAWTGRRLAAYLPGRERMASLDPRGGAWAETTTPPPLGPSDFGQLLWTGRNLFVFANGAAVEQGGLPDF